MKSHCLWAIAILLAAIFGYYMGCDSSHVKPSFVKMIDISGGNSNDTMVVMVSQISDFQNVRSVLGDAQYNRLEWYNDEISEFQKSSISYAVVMMEFPRCVAQNISIVKGDGVREVVDTAYGLYAGPHLRIYAGWISDDKRLLYMVGDWGDMKRFTGNIYDIIFRLQSNWGGVGTSNK